MVYKDFLREINGCFIFDFALFGLTPSIYTTGLLDRSKVQCFDLGTANRSWISEYEIDEKLFHFGGRAYSYDENIGYFIDINGIIKSIRINGQIIKEWSDFSEFLRDEIEAAEKMMIDELPKAEKEKL
ncbi:MAG: SMI1/KNR4 family protein [Bacteroidales bacterium]|nr:SMI1/KNR4 family protein [Bacteroidales bacterium]